MDGLGTQGSSRAISHGLREYRLVVYPDTAVYNKLMNVKHRFYDHYRLEETVGVFPHINVAGFHATEGMEETLIRWIQRICGRFRSFPVHLNNYNGIPNHTIYLRVQNQQPFKQLGRELQVINDYVRSSSGRSAWLNHPHLSVAGDLAEDVFLKAMASFSRKTFHASFMANELVLLRRDHPFATAKTVNVFRFLPASVKTSGDTRLVSEASSDLESDGVPVYSEMA